MFIKYGALEFEIERIYRWDHRAVFDESGLDYLYDHIVIGVQCVLHESATRSDAVMGRPVQGNRGTYAAASVRDLRTYMMQPRLPLQVRIGPEFILESPARKPGKLGNLAYDCDAKGGPQPLSFNISKNYGLGRTIIATFEVETWINDFNDREKTPAILSNRWTMSHDLDELAYTTRTIQGRAVFRKDLLLGSNNAGAAQQPNYPDDFRSKLFHPVPDFFKRQSVHVSQSPDGCTVDYRVTDVEQPANINLNSRIAKIKGSVRAGWDKRRLGFLDVAQRYVQATIQCWGRRTTTRRELIKACARALSSIGFKFADSADGIWPLYHCSWDIGLFDRYASVTMGCVASSYSDLLTLAMSNAGNRGWRSNIVADFPEFMEGITNNNQQQSAPLPNCAGTVGTHVGRLVSQALSNPSTVPSRPTDPGNRKYLNLYGAGGY